MSVCQNFGIRTCEDRTRDLHVVSMTLSTELTGLLIDNFNLDNVELVKAITYTAL